MKNIVGIYKITSPSGSIYIGQSWNIKRRFSDYKGGKKTVVKQTVLHRSFLKYGVQNHKFEVLIKFEDTINQEELDRSEVCEIQILKNRGCKLLNVREGGKGGGRHSEATKAIIREKRKFQITTEETRKKMSESRLKLKFKHTDETKRKISIANSGANNACFGKPMAEYTKQRLRETYKPHPKGENHPCYGKLWSQERKQKMKGVIGIWMKGKKMSEETKAKMRQSGSSKPISQYTKEGEFVKNWSSAKEASRFLNKRPAHITAVNTGKRKSAYGFIWRYAS